MVAAIAFLVGGWAMAKERKTASDPRIGNLSKVRREQLADKVSQIRSYLLEASAHDKNAARLLSFVAELEKEVHSKKYGLIFEEHKERVDIELEENIPVLKENRKRFIDNVGEMNFLIEGDNLAALKLLEKTHRGKIDLIYIDPPYNTGNKDFIYNDSFVDKTDGYRHSKWLSFMEKRLKLAKRLMSRNGIIYVSIDDNEQAQLRMLMDDIWGENNFIGTIAWESKTKCQNTKTARKQFQRKWEYILLYKNKSGRYEFILEEVGYHTYDKKDNKGEYREKEIEQMSASGMRGRTTMVFPILGVMPRKGFQWKYGKETVEEFSERGDLELIDGKPSFRIRPEDDTAKCKPYWSLIDKSYGTGESANTELKQIIGPNDFETVKPHRLIEYLIGRVSSSTNDSVILDFFAGSGTTGHAVMRLNAEDGGKRKFILVTNNENGICEKITYERLKRVIAKEKYAARLKYLKVDYVPITEEGYWERAEELLKYIRELVELENGIDFAHDKSVAIVLTDNEAELFLKNEKRLSACKTLYRGHNVMFTAKMNAVLSESGIAVKTIPDYYYPELED